MEATRERPTDRPTDPPLLPPFPKSSLSLWNPHSIQRVHHGGREGGREGGSDGHAIPVAGSFRWLAGASDRIAFLPSPPQSPVLQRCVRGRRRRRRRVKKTFHFLFFFFFFLCHDFCNERKEESFLCLLSFQQCDGGFQIAFSLPPFISFLPFPSHHHHHAMLAGAKTRFTFRPYSKCETETETRHYST